LLALRVFRQIEQRPIIGARERLVVESPDEVFLAESSLLDAGQDDRTDQDLPSGVGFTSTSGFEPSLAHVTLQLSCFSV
jgi:hypothetical protein